MTTYDQLSYELLLTDKNTRSEIRRAKRQAAHRAGRAHPLRFHVISHVDESEKPVMASGVLNRDGTKLLVTFTLPDGTEGAREYDYAELLNIILDNY